VGTPGYTPGGYPPPAHGDRDVMRVCHPMRIAYVHFLRVSKFAESEEETCAHQQVWARG
jgi:hypothetical protein